MCTAAPRPGFTKEVRQELWNSQPLSNLEIPPQSKINTCVPVYIWAYTAALSKFGEHHATCIASLGEQEYNDPTTKAVLEVATRRFGVERGTHDCHLTGLCGIVSRHAPCPS